MSDGRFSPYGPLAVGSFAGGSSCQEIQGLSQTFGGWDVEGGCGQTWRSALEA